MIRHIDRMFSSKGYIEFQVDGEACTVIVQERFCPMPISLAFAVPQPVSQDSCSVAVQSSLLADVQGLL